MTKPHPFSPRDIIHSAPTPSPSSSSSSSKSRLLQVFSPRRNSTRQPITFRRLFGRSLRRGTSTSHNSDEQSTPPLEQPPPETERESDESTVSPIITSPRTRRRRQLWYGACACFSPFNKVDLAAHEYDLEQHLKTLEPTYEPETPLLPGPAPHDEDRICLVLDLDETLVHSSFTPLEGADFEIPLEMQGETHTVYVKKRPGVDEFLQKVSQWYEIVLFTASLALYANPVMDLLDPEKLVQLRLYREHCVLIGGCYVKDIARLGRDLRRTFIIDNSPLSYVFQPENAIPITAFFTDDNDRELEKTLALLEQAKYLEDVRKAFS